MKRSDVIQVERFYAHPPAAIWRALTDPALLRRWWAAGDVRPVVGHRFELDMGQWGQQPCEVLEVEHERLLRYRYATTSLDTIITWRLVPEGGGTRLELTHEGFDLESPLGRKALEGMTPGWPRVLARLASMLSRAGGSMSRVGAESVPHQGRRTQRRTVTTTPAGDGVIEAIRTQSGACPPEPAGDLVRTPREDGDPARSAAKRVTG